MKKIIVFSIIAILALPQFAFAFGRQKIKPIEPVQKITFIYINGSNDFKSEDRVKFKEHFKKNVHDMHPYMVKAFTKDKLIHKTLLKNGAVEINKEPVIFYWGDRSLNQVQQLDNDLAMTKKFSPRISQAVRSTFAHCLHDAVWVQKYQNMSVLTDDLHKVVKDEADMGNQVVLFGYSAGSFITYEYFLSKFISLHPDELSFNKSPELATIMNENPAKKTCLDALMEANVVKLDLYGRYMANGNIAVVKENYPKIDEYTDSACFKDGTIKGVVNFASPLSLFYSEFKNEKSDLNFLSKLMYKHILETDTFWLTVNFREDPLGFPASKNLTKEELTELSGGKVHSNGGFVYDKPDVRSGRTFVSAHLAYWELQRRFVKGVVQAYNKGYKNLYKNVLETEYL